MVAPSIVEKKQNKRGDKGEIKQGCQVLTKTDLHHSYSGSREATKRR